MKKKADIPGAGRAAKNLVAGWIVQLAGVLYAFVTVPLITRAFGFEGLGIWLIIQQVSGHLQLFEIGINTSLGRYLSRFLAQSDMQKHNAYLSAAFIILSGACLIVLLSTAFISAHLADIFDITSSYGAQAFWMVLFAGVATGLMLPLRVGLGVLASRHRFDIISKWELVVVALKLFTVLLVCFGLREDGLVWLSLGVFGSMLLCGFLLFFESLRTLPESRIALSFVTWASAKALLSISASTLIISAAAVVLRQGAPMFVGVQFGVEAVPLLALPLMIVTTIGPFVNITNKLIAPIASHADATHQRERLFNIVSFSSQYALSGAFGLLCVFAAVGKSFLLIWLGKKNLSLDQVFIIYDNTLFVLGSFCLSIPALLGRSVMSSVGQHWQAAISEVTCVLFGMAVGMLLVFYFDAETWGMAVGVGATYLVRIIGRVVPALAQYFSASIFKVYVHMWGRAFLIGAFTLTLVVVSPRYLGDNWTNRLIGDMVIMSMWSVLTFAFVVKMEHRALLMQYLRHLGR
ncbi:O-antigen/teichoic acid export membrane protein [Peteryoungia aggregata LMG 23059]|uniref:O-antigen/teichoic acid export membrane protein n=1 Tax=Peteryoungia aggregata LMG 23059 TaxID=1368425 RepID=A0ABU0GD57_9HYPH|nr:hypothetical protein [Peteryoungia aggregata]MDQ0423284.1 O-antigen/teichoic acid export membrane protein [Peteryoungia aggregata LMG 23059]